MLHAVHACEGGALPACVASPCPVSGEGGVSGLPLLYVMLSAAECCLGQRGHAEVPGNTVHIYRVSTKGLCLMAR